MMIFSKLNQHSPFLIILSAPSGGGKTTVFRNILARDTRIAYSISMTTRPKRKNEIDGKDYFFVTPAQFEKQIAEDEFAEWAIVHNYYYGTPKTYIQQKLTQGYDIILDIDIQGAQKIQTVFPENVSIFLVPPSLGILEERLRKRQTDSEETIQTRLENAKTEMKHLNEYDYIVVNDNLNHAIEQTYAIIQAERCHLTRISKDIETIEFD